MYMYYLIFIYVLFKYFFITSKKYCVSPIRKREIYYGYSVCDYQVRVDTDRDLRSGRPLID